MRDAFIKYCMDNKKPFDTDYYEENGDGVLLRDCVRAADIIDYELTRERGADDRKLMALLREYARLHRYLLERLLEIYKDNADVLKIAFNISELLDVMGKTADLTVTTVVIKTIRTMLLKFA